jgi:hypothetical protein
VAAECADGKSIIHREAGAFSALSFSSGNSIFPDFSLLLSGGRSACHKMFISCKRNKGWRRDERLEFFVVEEFLSGFWVFLQSTKLLVESPDVFLD